MIACGVVALFDILGYKQFLRHNPCDEAAELVVRTIADAESDVLSYIKETAQGEKDADIFIRSAQSVTWAVFSDTVILLCPFDQPMAPVDRVRRWHAVILSAQILSKYMFEEGLPLQGCIDYGHFIQERYCFGGKTVLDAYESANCVPFAGSVLSPKAIQELRSAAEPFALQQDLTAKLLLMASVIEYGLPCDGGVKETPTLNFLAVTGISKHPSAWTGDYSEIVHRAFTKHNKPLDDRAKMKAKNTAAYLAFLDRKFPGVLKEKASN